MRYYHASGTMRNKEIVDLLNRIADLLEIKGEIVFKLRAYREAARQVEMLQVPIEKLWEEGRLNTIPGFGEAIVKKVSEYLETGKLNYLEEIKKEIPEGLADLLEIPGFGPKGIKKVYETLGITTIEELKQAALEGRIRTLPGFGERKEQAILEGIKFLERKTGRALLPTALSIFNSYKNHLIETLGLDHNIISEAGSLRRRLSTIGDIDILVSSDDNERIIEYFVKAPWVQDVLAKGTTKASIRDQSGIQVDLRVIEPKSYGAALQYFTGSKAHNVKLRTLAVKRDWSINEYALTDSTGKVIASKSEEEIYNALGLRFIPPELREDTGEIEAAAQNALPKLVSLSDIRGEVHCHSKWSDGHSSIEEMVKAAIDRGYEYIVITDHSRSLGIAGGLDARGFSEQRKEIERINELYGDRIRVLQGAEVNILAEGELDLDLATLKSLDFAIASIHSSFTMSQEKMTARILKAINTGMISALGHPTGRLLEKRDAISFDFEKVFSAAANAGVALEINSQPERLDLAPELARVAKGFGVKFIIGTDAHDPTQLQYMELGVSQARKAWLEKEDIINCQSLDELLKLRLR